MQKDCMALMDSIWKFPVNHNCLHLIVLYLMETLAATEAFCTNPDEEILLWKFRNASNVLTKLLPVRSKEFNDK